MTLPEFCPLDENETCKGRECHLFCLEWRTREPTCLIGYNTTSKIRSGRNDRKKDTYAEDTFHKLGRQPLPRRKSVSEKGDWTPTRPIERPPERPAERREKERVFERGEEVPFNAPFRVAEGDTQKFFFGCQETNRDVRPEKTPEERLEKQLQGRQDVDETEKASLRLEARLKKEPVEEKSIIYAKLQSKAQEKPKAQEKVVSRDKHTTIFESCDREESKNICPSCREEKPKKAAEIRDKRKKLDEVMDINLPDNYEEEFWS